MASSELRELFRAMWAYCNLEAASDALLEAARRYAGAADTPELDRACTAVIVAWRPMAPELERRGRDGDEV